MQCMCICITQEYLIDFTQQVAMAAIHTYLQNSSAYKVFGLVEALSTISSQVMDEDVLQVTTSVGKGIKSDSTLYWLE